MYATTLLNVISGEDLWKLCTQEVYARFMSSLANIVEKVCGNTTRRTNDPAAEKPATSNDERIDWGEPPSHQLKPDLAGCNL